MVYCMYVFMRNLFAIALAVYTHFITSYLGFCIAVDCCNIAIDLSAWEGTNHDTISIFIEQCPWMHNHVVRMRTHAQAIRHQCRHSAPRILCSHRDPQRHNNMLN